MKKQTKTIMKTIGLTALAILALIAVFFAGCATVSMKQKSVINETMPINETINGTTAINETVTVNETRFVSVDYEKIRKQKVMDEWLQNEIDVAALVNKNKEFIAGMKKSEDNLQMYKFYAKKTYDNSLVIEELIKDKLNLLEDNYLIFEEQGINPDYEREKIIDAIAANDNAQRIALIYFPEFEN